MNHPSYGIGDPGDEATGDLRVIRNGKLFAHRETLGAAKALIRRVQAAIGTCDHWAVMDGRTVLYRAEANRNPTERTDT